MTRAALTVPPFACPGEEASVSTPHGPGIGLRARKPARAALLASLPALLLALSAVGSPARAASEPLGKLVASPDAGTRELAIRDAGSQAPAPSEAMPRSSEIQPAPSPSAEPKWEMLGLMRVRDMTPFGMSRLDMLPAHAVAATPGTYAFEITASYQNTWALSDNVKEYLAQRGIKRGAIGPSDIAAIQALPGDAYLVDGELGLADLTLHYRATPHLGLYATIPYYTFEGGFLDSTIEGFHKLIGNGSAGRDFAPRNRFKAVVFLDRASLILEDAPGNEFGDPVFGIRYSLSAHPERFNVVFETAAKVVLDHSSRLVSTGRNDYGWQVSLQRFLRRNAFYLTLSEIYFKSPDTGLSADLWIPTVIAGWETRLTRHANFIVQGYASKSTVQETRLDELSAPKIQATLGIQWRSRGRVLRFGITENLANFDNTPDIGVNLSFGRIFFGGRDKGERGAGRDD